MWEVKGVLALNGRKERKCGAIIVLKEDILLEIALILPVGNVERKDMKKSHALSNFLDYLLFGIKEWIGGAWCGWRIGKM